MAGEERNRDGPEINEEIQTTKDHKPACKKRIQKEQAQDTLQRVDILYRLS